MARNTVKKYLRSNEMEPTYAKRVSSSKRDPYAEKLTTWLGMEATKSRKQRRNLKHIYTDRCQFGILFETLEPGPPAGHSPVQRLAGNGPRSRPA